MDSPWDCLIDEVTRRYAVDRLCDTIPVTVIDKRSDAAVYTGQSILKVIGVSSAIRGNRISVVVVVVAN